MHPSQNHLKTDDFCQENSNPTLYEEDKKKGLPAILDKENSEAAEQTFRWMGLFGNIIRTMGQERAYFFLIRMCERHNRCVAKSLPCLRLCSATLCALLLIQMHADVPVAVATSATASSASTKTPCSSCVRHTSCRSSRAHLAMR